MKKFAIIFAAVAMFAVACQKTEKESSVKMVPVSFTASALDTKTSLDGVHVEWTAGDVILIGKMESIANGSVSIGTNVFELTAQSSGASTSFSGELPADLVESGKGFAVYCVPGLYQVYVANNNASGKRCSPRWASASTQTGVCNGVSTDTMMLYAYTNDGDGSAGTCTDIDFVNKTINFHPGFALIKVGVAGSGIKKITLSTAETATTKNNALGGGTMNFNIKSGQWSLVDASTALQTLDLVPEAGLATFAPGDYYFAIPACRTADNSITGLTITYTKSDDSSVSKTSENVLQALSGKIYRTGIDETKCN